MAKVGRPSTEINKETFENLCGILCTLEEIAAIFNCCDDTINRWCQKEYGDNFAGIYKKLSSGGKSSLRRAQWNSAQKGNVPMQIWLGKQWLGQRDAPIDEDRGEKVSIVDDI